MADDEPEDRCDATDCFRQLQIRDFEVIDDTTLLVYVGSQHCPFRVDFMGPDCDLTFLPGGGLTFRPDYLRAQREPDFAVRKVCSTDSNIGIDEGPFTRAAGSSNGFGDIGIDGQGRIRRTPNPTDPDPRLSCRIRDVESLTDDEVLELYVEHEIVAPPPPFGTGQLEVPAEGDDPNTEQGTAAPTGEPGETAN